MTPAFWKGRRVLVTGHTGFKGGWLTLWLAKMGARVHGFALPPATIPGMYDAAGVSAVLEGETLGDLRDPAAVEAAVAAAEAEVVLHLAAQPLVRYSYAAPVETYATNVMGLVHLLEGIRKHPGAKAVVNVTTDKCYENREWVWPYREDEALGGFDPYSSSKACAEIVTQAYRRSFLANEGVAVATARAGNVIGGGDWSSDRLVPDFLREIDAGRTLRIRSPHAVRPWQHVLEPLSGYLLLAEKLFDDADRFGAAWNFGPEDEDVRSVQWIVERLCSATPGARWELDGTPQPHEASLLKLDSSKAKSALGWRPRWRLGEALDQTLAWHQDWNAGADMHERSLRQIDQFLATPANE